MYRENDDGKVVNGRIVVFLRVPGSDRTNRPVQRRISTLEPESRAELARAQAAVLTTAARDGAPLCEECDRARRDLEGP